MSSSEIRSRLRDEIARMTIIDCHEHLMPERLRTGRPVDATILFSHYCETDLLTAGMSRQDYDRMRDHTLPLDYRWGLLSPYLGHVKDGSYARAGLIAARELYGFEDVNDSNYLEVSAKLQEGNTPGLYQRILGDKCGIEAALTQCDMTATESELLIPLMWAFHITEMRNAGQIRALGERAGMTLNTLSDAVEAAERVIVRWKKEGAIGLKVMAQEFGEPSRAEASSAFESAIRGTELPTSNPLGNYLLDRCLALAGKHDLVVAVHAGMWGDFRTLDPKLMIPVFPRHPGTRFDLYHAGMPWVRETGVIGTNNPNVWLNLCWCHIISPRMTVNMLDEWMDFVPMNRIFAFGGDYGAPVEKVVGHLWLARDDVAQVLARRVRRGEMTEDRALEIARMWFYDNPREAYRIPAYRERMKSSGTA